VAGGMGGDKSDRRIRGGFCLYFDMRIFCESLGERFEVQDTYETKVVNMTAVQTRRIVMMIEKKERDLAMTIGVASSSCRLPALCVSDWKR
jgi:hypothetical protein